MKKIYTLIAAALLATGAAAQNPTAYFMESSTFRSQFNPAFAPLRGYVNIPVIGGMNITVGGNLAVADILFSRDGKLVTLLDSSVSAADALSGLKQDNLLGMDFRMNVIGFGAFTKNHKNFWSFDLNVRVNEDANLPYSLFEFIKLGKEGQIRNFGTSMDSYLEAAFSYSFPLMDDRLYVGIRGKFLAGLARAQVTYDRFDISLREDRWAVLTQGTLDLTAAGAEVEMNPDSETFEIGDLDFKPTKPAGYGFALDLGATYDILPNLQASLAVTDLGFISWSKKNSVMGVSTQETEFTGATVPENASEPVPDFDLEMLKFNQVDGRSTTKMLRASINAGLEYEVWRHKIGIGLLYTARVWKYKTMHNITGSVNFHPVRWFTVSGSYSVIDNRGGAVGLALNLCPNWINFYLATDVLTSKHTPQRVPIKQSTMSREFTLRMLPAGRTGHPDRRPQREKKRICHPKKTHTFGILDAPISLSGKAVANPETFFIFVT